MLFDAHANFAYSTVATAPSPASSGTSLIVGAGQGTRFPAVPFNAAVWPANQIPTPDNSEIVRVTNISTDTLTIARAEEGSNARTIVVGDQIAATITTKTLTDLEAVFGVPQTIADTGDLGTVDLDGPVTVVRCTGAAPVFDAGFTVAGGTPYAGCRARIVCLGTSAKIEHANSVDTDVVCPSVAGQIVGVNGVMEIVYDATTERWREAVIETGLPVAVAHDAGNFVGGGSQTWTVASGDQIRYAYVQRGNVVTVFYVFEATSVGGTPDAALNATLPQGFVVDGDAWAVNGFTLDNNVVKTGVVRAVNNASVLRFYVDNTLGVNWAASTNLTSLRGSHTFTVD